MGITSSARIHYSEKSNVMNPLISFRDIRYFGEDFSPFSTRFKRKDVFTSTK